MKQEINGHYIPTGKRIYTYRNDKGEWIDKKIQLTNEFNKLFEKYSINLDNIKNEILEKSKHRIFQGK